MNKSAQIDSPLLTTPISSNQGIMNVWNKYFAAAHAKIVRILRSNLKNEPSLQTALGKAFPGYEWPEFADMPTNNTFASIKTSLDRIMAVPQAKAAAGIEHAIQAYTDQYDMMLKQLQGNASKEPARPAIAKKPQQPSEKVKELQRLLSVDQTGLWNPATNTAFIAWLKSHGWDKYLSGDKFTGNLNDAITTILAENTPTESAQRQASRAIRLKKLGLL